MVLEHLGKLTGRRGDPRSSTYLEEAALLSREMNGEV
jgi:hypothetical protein